MVQIHTDYEKPGGCIDRLYPIDYILGAIVGICFWYQKHFGNKNMRCKLSPDGLHDSVTRDCKHVCSYCGMGLDYGYAEDAQGKNPEDRIF